MSLLFLHGAVMIVFILIVDDKIVLEDNHVADCESARMLLTPRWRRLNYFSI